MRKLSWAPSFRRAVKGYTRRHPDSRAKVDTVLRALAEDPFSDRLDTHKLRGTLSGLWACTVEYDCRVVFGFVTLTGEEEDAILLVDIGTYDEVY